MSRDGNGVDKVFWGMIVVLLVAIGIVFLWKRSAVDQVEDRAEERRRVLVERSRDALEGQAAELLRLTALPLGWAVREQVLDDNYGVLGDLFDEMVAERDVQRIVYAGVNDSILVSTDQRLQGRPLAEVSGAASGEDRVTVRERENGGYDVIVPIMGFAQKRGVVVLTYDGEAIERRIPAVEPVAGNGQPPPDRETP